MAGNNGGFKVECNEFFPLGVGVVGNVTELLDYKRSTKDKPVQAYDEESGMPMWQVDVMDFDPEARERTYKVKMAARQQPVPPDSAVPNLPIRPVYLEGLFVLPYMKSLGVDQQKQQERFKIGYSLRATGLAAPRAHRNEGKAA